MGAFEVVIGILMILVSVGIIVFVLMQQSRENGLSGAIAGGSANNDTFFGKNKGRTKEAQLSRFTKFLGIGFFVLSVAAVFLLALIK